VFFLGVGIDVNDTWQIIDRFLVPGNNVVLNFQLLFMMKNNNNRSRCKVSLLELSPVLTVYSLLCITIQGNTSWYLVLRFRFGDFDLDLDVLVLFF
jgi:hypothetical protein